MTGWSPILLLLCGLGLAMAVLVVCRGHWYALIDTMHRCPHDLLRRLDWPLQHPFGVPGTGAADGPFPVRRLRARVLLHGMPAPVLCPAPARRHARAFRLWAAAFLTALAGVGAILLSPVVPIILALGLAVQFALVPRWPRPEKVTP